MRSSERFRPPWLGNDSLVLAYHAVSPTWTVPLSVTPDALERQLTWLVRHGWRGATFRDAVLNPPSGKTLVVSFDDAFLSVLERAYPILSALGLPGTVFAPTGFMSRRQPLEWDGIDHWEKTSELEGMCWDDLGVLADAGWEVGSHTRTHPHLPRLGDEALRAELADSRAEVEKRLGRPCQTIAYPYGDVDERVTGSTSAAGYSAGAELSHRLTNLGPYRWPRVGIYYTDAMWRFQTKASRAVRFLRASHAWPWQ